MYSKMISPLLSRSLLASSRSLTVRSVQYSLKKPELGWNSLRSDKPIYGGGKEMELAPEYYNNHIKWYNTRVQNLTPAEEKATGVAFTRDEIFYPLPVKTIRWLVLIATVPLLIDMMMDDKDEKAIEFEEFEKLLISDKIEKMDFIQSRCHVTFTTKDNQKYRMHVPRTFNQNDSVKSHEHLEHKIAEIYEKNDISKENQLHVHFSEKLRLASLSFEVTSIIATWFFVLFLVIVAFMRQTKLPREFTKMCRRNGIKLDGYSKQY